MDDIRVDHENGSCCGFSVAITMFLAISLNCQKHLESHKGQVSILDIPAEFVFLLIFLKSIDIQIEE